MHPTRAPLETHVCLSLSTVLSLQRAVQTSRAGAKPLLVTLLKAVGELFVATQQAACLDMLATIAEVFGEVKSAPELAAAQQQALEGGCFLGRPLPYIWPSGACAWQGMSGRCASDRVCRQIHCVPKLLRILADNMMTRLPARRCCGSRVVCACQPHGSRAAPVSLW
jgi:hypothetical protein